MTGSKIGGSLATFLVQQFWWALNVPQERLGFDRRGLHTARRARAHARLRREVHLGLLTGGLRYPNIIDLHAYWMNERFERCRVSVDPDPADADVLWVYSQDPLPAGRRTRIEQAIALAGPGVPVINPPEVVDYYHRDDAFSRLEAAGVPVPRSRFGADDHGLPVIWKPEGMQSTTRGPVAYAGPVAGQRPFEYFDVGGADRQFVRYRACYLLGDIYAGSAMRAPGPIVRYRNAVDIDSSWTLTGEEAGHVRRIAEISGLNFFTVDFLRLPANGAPVFVDINAFSMFKDSSPPGYYGHRHDFDKLRPSDGGPPGAWLNVEQRIVDMVNRAARPS